MFLLGQIHFIMFSWEGGGEIKISDIVCHLQNSYQRLTPCGKTVLKFRQIGAFMAQLPYSGQGGLNLVTTVPYKIDSGQLNVKDIYFTCHTKIIYQCCSKHTGSPCFTYHESLQSLLMFQLN